MPIRGKRKSLKEEKTPTINVFPNDEITWRIDWLAGVSYPYRSVMRGQPSVEVYLSAIDPETGHALPRRTTQRKYVSIGTLVLLRIGEHWHRKQLVHSPRYMEEEWEVGIYPSTVSTIPSGLSIDDEFVLPLAEHPGHECATQSFCVNVELPDGRCMVIPTLELTRFYFGSSSTLLERLFAPPLSMDGLFTNASIKNGVAHLDLAKGIHRRSAHDVARIAFDKLACDAAELIGNSCVEQSAQQKHRIHPKARFPFHGKTTLRARGQWLSRGDAPNRTFLVFELLSCSRRFPYRELNYTIHPETEKHRAASKLAEGEGSQNVSSAKPGVAGLEQEDASKGLAGRTFWLRRLNQFPDLIGKRAFGTVSLDSSADETGGGSVAKPAKHGAVGAEVSSGRLGAVVLNTGAATKPPDYLLAVIAALPSLGCEANLLTGGGEDGWTVQWPPAPVDRPTGGQETDCVAFTAFALQNDISKLSLVASFHEDKLNLVLLPHQGARLDSSLQAAYMALRSKGGAGVSAAHDDQPPGGIKEWLRQGVAERHDGPRSAAFCTPLQLGSV